MNRTRRILLTILWVWFIFIMSWMATNCQRDPYTAVNDLPALLLLTSTWGTAAIFILYVIWKY